MADVIVVGGGTIGCSLAYYLAKGGAQVTLLERGELAGEASGAAAGMLAALSDEGSDRGPDFQRLCLDSLKLFDSLLPDLEATRIDVRYQRSGVLHLAMSEAEAERLRERYVAQRAIAPANALLEGGAIHGEEPAASKRATAGLLVPDEHYLDPQRLTIALATAARNLGATIRTNEGVTGFQREGTKLRGVRTMTARYEADHVVLAGGPWTGELARALDVQIPVKPIRGQMLSLRGPETPLRHVIWGARAYLVPREDNQTFVGASVEDVGFRKRTTTEVLARLKTGAVELVPSLRKAGKVRDWAGLRPATPDGLPIMGLLPGWSNAWVATGHFRNGILLTPVTGALMSSSILGGAPAAQLVPFKPARFAD